MQILQALLLCSFPVLVVLAAVRDAASFTIPNWLSLALAAAFVAAAAACGLAPVQIGLHLAVGVAVLVIGMGFFAAGWLGGGDVKLLAAASMWMGWPGTLQLLLLTALAGGGLTFILMALRSPILAARAAAGPAWFARLATKGEAVPYGLAIAAGALPAFAASPLLAGFLNH